MEVPLGRGPRVARAIGPVDEVTVGLLTEGEECALGLVPLGHAALEFGDDDATFVYLGRVADVRHLLRRALLELDGPPRRRWPWSRTW